ncbi:uncharacterized protein LOC121593797 [Anopheles merus]|uniref:HSF-type DNA-binding domain-containing protein n=1 Tax=Anopheles merus TaxID=30066 RepID=A0A182UM80_ANOME|nr:uncharacterized protein LOC121593797 [Anopheles merus]
MEYITIDNDSIPESDLLKLHFVLKLWIAVNTELVDYLCWNQDQTRLIVNVPAMVEQWRTGDTTIFLLNRVEDFLLMLKINGFQQCADESLEETERAKLGTGCRVFCHHQFLGSNCDFFNQWLCWHEERENDFELKVCCTLPKDFEWPVGEELEEFHNNWLEIIFEKMKIELHLRNSICQQENVTVDIPPEYVDQVTMPAPNYGDDIAGNYGPVAREELQKFFGNRLPIYFDPTTKQENESVIEKEENEPMSEDSKCYVIADAECQQHADQFADMRELYESIDFWKDNEGTVIEYHEIQDIPDVSETLGLEIKHEEEADKDLATLSTGEETMQMSHNMSQYLTDSMKCLLPPIDSD